MKKFIFGVLMVLGLSTPSWADPMADQMFEPSVQIGDYCSGEIIKSDRDVKTGEVETYVLTAKHCTENDGKIVTVNKALYDNHNRQTGVKTYLADVYGQSYKSDLALLKLRDKQTYFEHVAKVAPRDITLTYGQNVELVGYPLGRSMTWTSGRLGYVEDGVFKDVSQSGQFYRATPDLAPGSSGSSMFTWNDQTKEYQVIGVTTGGAMPITFFNFFTPVEEINDYLNVVFAKRAIK
jgi:S1-C subfamily serine protease